MENSEQAEQKKVTQSIGRIEVAPEVITTIARFVTQGADGVARMGTPPSEVGRLFRRASRQDGVILHYVDGKLVFDIYVLMEPQVNMLECSRKLQTAIVEAIDKMVSIPVEAVNIHVEDIAYVAGERQ